MGMSAFIPMSPYSSRRSSYLTEYTQLSFDATGEDPEELMKIEAEGEFTVPAPLHGKFVRASGVSFIWEEKKIDKKIDHLRKKFYDIDWMLSPESTCCNYNNFEVARKHVGTLGKCLQFDQCKIRLRQNCQESNRSMVQLIPLKQKPSTMNKKCKILTRRSRLLEGPNLFSDGFSWECPLEATWDHSCPLV